MAVGFSRMMQNVQDSFHNISFLCIVWFNATCEWKPRCGERYKSNLGFIGDVFASPANGAEV